jgi:hypothetical protein
VQTAIADERILAAVGENCVSLTWVRNKKGYRWQAAIAHNPCAIGASA